MPTLCQLCFHQGPAPTTPTGPLSALPSDHTASAPAPPSGADPGWEHSSWSLSRQPRLGRWHWALRVTVQATPLSLPVSGSHRPQPPQQQGAPRNPQPMVGSPQELSFPTLEAARGHLRGWPVTILLIKPSPALLWPLSRFSVEGERPEGCPADPRLAQSPWTCTQMSGLVGTPDPGRVSSRHGRRGPPTGHLLCPGNLLPPQHTGSPDGPWLPRHSPGPSLRDPCGGALELSWAPAPPAQRGLTLHGEQSVTPPLHLPRPSE